MARELVELDLHDFDNNKSDFINEMGKALEDIGFFALKGHGIEFDLLSECYKNSKRFFKYEQEIKSKYEKKEIHCQRGYTKFGKEHSKDNPAPDLKEFYQIGRTIDVDHPESNNFLQNVWPDEIPTFKNNLESLYSKLEECSNKLLSACSLYLGMPQDWLSSMAKNGNTILRIIHYPPLPDERDPNSVRSSQHEDINLITLLCASTESGLEVMDHDGSWFKVETGPEYIVVDTGDMIQNITNGLFKSTTHRVVNPDNSNLRRFSMPMFVHPRNDIDLSPLPKFIESTGGEQKYQNITAGEYLHQRLVEIGLADS
jgi:isopenicillin N synthase-like dioxygenase